MNDQPTAAPTPDPDPFAVSETDPAVVSEEVVPEEVAPKTAKRSRPFWKELPVLVLMALVVAVLIKSFLVQAFYIPSGSMRNTLEPGDRVMVNRLAYRFGEPDHGDVIVFDSPFADDHDGESIPGAVIRHIGEALGIGSPAADFIKRVIGAEGETVEVRDGAVWIDGKRLDEPYLPAGTTMPDDGPWVVPEGHVFVMGDNRNFSQDSRKFGPIPVGDIVGRAFVRVWPPSRWGGL